MIVDVYNTRFTNKYWDVSIKFSGINCRGEIYILKPRLNNSSFIRNLLAQVIGLNDNHDVLIEDVVSIIFQPDRGWELLESAIIIKLKPDKS